VGDDVGGAVDNIHHQEDYQEDNKDYQEDDEDYQMDDEDHQDSAEEDGMTLRALAYLFSE
jgi:hypothetical protein